MSRDEDLAQWKTFSVQEALNVKNGPHWSLPVLEGGSSSDPTQPIRKKSSLKFSGGRLAKISGAEPAVQVETYLETFQRTYAKRR